MPSLPMFLFAGVATVASGLVMLLPETFNNKLPDTIADAEDIGRLPPKIDADATAGHVNVVCVATD